VTSARPQPANNIGAIVGYWLGVKGLPHVADNGPKFVLQQLTIIEPGRLRWRSVFNECGAQPLSWVQASNIAKLRRQRADELTETPAPRRRTGFAEAGKFLIVPAHGTWAWRLQAVAPAVWRRDRIHWERGGLVEAIDLGQGEFTLVCP